MARSKEQRKVAPRPSLAPEREPEAAIAPPIPAQLMPQTGGQPLDLATQATMARSFGHNFAAVRIHAGEQAEESAAAIGARAFAIGRDIAFGAGQYAPNTGAGQRLLAHELTHVVQHDRAPHAPQVGVSRPGDLAEREATTVAEAVASGRPLPTISATPAAAMHLDPQTEKPDQAKYSTTLPSSAALNDAGAAQFAVNADGQRITTIILPDVYDLAADADPETQCELQWEGMTWGSSEGKIAEFSPYKVTMTIQTHYPQGYNPNAASAYGRGTTAADVGAGNTSVRFHESQHGNEAINYLKNLPNPKDPKKKSHDPLPKFKGTKGMAEEDFVKARDEYEAAMTRYREKLIEDNVAKVDKVGTPKKDPPAGQ